MANYDDIPGTSSSQSVQTESIESDPALFEPNPTEAKVLKHAKAGTTAYFGEGGVIRAEFLRILLTGLRKDWPLTDAGVQVSRPKDNLFGHATLTGTLELTGALQLSGARAKGGGPLPPLQLNLCVTKNPLHLDGSQFKSLDFANCQNLTVKAHRIEILGDLFLDNAQCNEINFSEAKIGGYVNADKAVVLALPPEPRSAQPAVDLTGMDIGIDPKFAEDLVESLRNPDDSDAFVPTPPPCRFSFYRAQVGGNVIINGLWSHQSVLDFNELRAGGGFWAENLRVWNQGHGALQATNAKIGSSVYLNRSRFLGQVALMRLQAQAVFLQRCYISDRQKNANSDRYSMAFLMDGAKATSVNLQQSVFRGMAACSNMTVEEGIDLGNCLFVKPFADALSLSGTSADGLYFYETRTRGGVIALSASFSLVLAPGAVFDGAGSPNAFSLAGSTIEQDLNFGGHSQMKAASFIGCLSLRNAHIRKSLSLIGVGFQAHKSVKICLDMCRTKIDGAMTIRTLVGPRDGMFIMDGAEIDTLDDNPETGWPKAGLLDLDGLIYRTIKIPSKGGLGTALSDTRVAWLKRQYKDGKPEQGEFRPQPFEHLAKVFRSQGYDYAAMKVSIEKRELQRKYADRGIARLIHTGLKITSDYGYSPARSLIWFVAWVALGAIVAKLGLGADIYEPANVDQPAVSHLEPISYAFDLSTPIIDFGQASAYRLKPVCSEILGMTFCGIRELLEVTYSTVGFVLFSILVLTFSGVLSREKD